MSCQRWWSGALTLTVVLVAGVTPALAYEQYTGATCGQGGCHGSFESSTTTKPGNTWPNNKHEVHRTQMLVRNPVSGVNPASCVFCHIDDGEDWNSNPLIGESDGDAAFGIPGIGCLGCHGRLYTGGGPAGQELGAGLRAHHAAEGVTCTDSCHTSDPTPLPESTPPTYYGLPGVNIVSPCDGSENFTSDTLGTDNDGDDLYEAADSDCSVAAADINLDPATLDYAMVVISNSKDLSTSVQNVGAADLDVTSISLCAGTSAEYTWSPMGPFTVGSGGSQTLTVTYAPTGEGSDTGCLSIGSNDPDEDPIELTLSGEGVACLADQILANQVVDQMQEIVACSSITIGPMTQVIEGHFRAGEIVELVGDVEAEQMTISIDPALIPPP